MDMLEVRGTLQDLIYIMNLWFMQVNTLILLNRLPTSLPLKDENTEDFNKLRNEYTEILQNFLKIQYDK